MRKLLSAAVLCLSTAIAIPAGADEAAPAPAVTPHLIGGNTGVIVGGVGDQGYLFGGIALDPGLVLGLGFGLDINGSKPSGSRTDALGIVHASYYLKNSANFAVGPELFVIMPFAPTAAETVTFQPGIALWYAPFSAPVLFGTALDAQVIYTKSAKTAEFKLLTPALRIGYAF